VLGTTLRYPPTEPVTTLNMVLRDRRVALAGDEAMKCRERDSPVIGEHVPGPARERLKFGGMGRIASPSTVALVANPRPKPEARLHMVPWHSCMTRSLDEGAECC
jgi:hypothetical protein